MIRKLKILKKSSYNRTTLVFTKMFPEEALALWQAKLRNLNLVCLLTPESDPKMEELKIAIAVCVEMIEELKQEYPELSSN